MHTPPGMSPETRAAIRAAALREVELHAPPPTQRQLDVLGRIFRAARQQRLARERSDVA